METVTQPQRSMDRVLEALSTLAALLNRTISEVRNVDSDFQARLLQAVHDTEASLQSQASQHLEKAAEEFKEERERLNQELVRAVEAALVLENERGRLLAEVDRLQQEAQAAAEAAAHAAPPTPAAPAISGSVTDEIDRIEAKLQEIRTLIDDPHTELSTVIRKNVERSELDAYLRGIRFAIGQTGK